MASQSMGSIKDMAGGILLCLVGLAALVLARTLPIGTPARMGAGFFPIFSAGLLILLGVLLILIRPDRGSARDSRPTNWRALVFIIAALLAWALLLNPLGLVLATMALSLIAAFAHPTPNPLRVGVTTIVLPLMGWAIFILGLGMPLRAWPW